MTLPTDPVARPVGVSHVRLTVTDIARSKAFYTAVFGADPVIDMTDKVDEPGVIDDPEQLYGGCVFAYGEQNIGLRPVGPTGGSFEPAKVGLDHLSLLVGSPADLEAAAERLATAGIEHGEIKDLGPDMPLKILSLQDPDDINLELSASTT